MRPQNLKPVDITTWFAIHGTKQLDETQKALILAQFGVRPKAKAGNLRQKKIIITWMGAMDCQLTGDVMRQVASIIKSHKQLSKFELLKICEDKLECKGSVTNAVNNAVSVLKRRRVIKVKDHSI